MPRSRLLDDRAATLRRCRPVLAAAAALLCVGAAEAQLPLRIRSFLSPRGPLQEKLATELIGMGPTVAAPLLSALSKSDAPDSAALRVLFAVLPASRSAEAAALAGKLDRAGRLQLIDWLARRDLKGFREVETLRAKALLPFLDDEASLARHAAEALARWDLPVVAKGLARRLTSAVAGKRNDPWPLQRAMARALVALRASKELVPELLAGPCGKELRLLGLLLPGLGHDPNRVLAGALDPYVHLRQPALEEGARAALLSVDRALFARAEHEKRLALFRRFRQQGVDSSEWALREAQTALLDLGSAEQAMPALAALRGMRLWPAQRVWFESYSAIAAFLDHQDPFPAVRRALFAAEEDWSLDPRLDADFIDEAGLADFQVFRIWRQQVEPRIGEREFQQRLTRLRRQGGAAIERQRAAGRRRLSVRLLGAVLFDAAGRKPEADAWLDAAGKDYEELSNYWQESLLGPNRELDNALDSRAGVQELLVRALEGNEASIRRQSKEERARRLAAAERGYRFLIRGLALRIPGRVLSLPEDRALPMRAAQSHAEVVPSDLTGSLARFYERIGEEEKAIQILDSLIQGLEGKGLQEARRMWATYLFSRASIAMDRKEAKIAKRCLTQFISYFEARHRDVRQNPERYYDPATAQQWFASQLASAYVSLAVLHNVVLGELEEARVYCEKAYALEDSTFNRVLYACYLARDGKSRDALELLASVDPSPPLYYNMACTFALCGRKKDALQYVELDLRVNHQTRKSRNRQRKWAMGDKDLESLHKDQDFLELVRPREPGEEDG